MNEIFVTCPSCATETFTGHSGTGRFTVIDAEAMCPSGHRIVFQTADMHYADGSPVQELSR